MTRKQVVAAVVATCTAVAGVIAFAANVVTIADFVGVDATASSGVAQPAVAQPQGTQSGPRLRVVPEIADTGIIPQPYERGAARPEVPPEFHGRWKGLVYQGTSSSSPYPVELVIGAGQAGDTVASVEYPTLQCGGSWRLQSSWDHMIRASEVVERGKFKCVDTTIELSTQPDGQVYYAFEANGGGVGVLRRP